MEKYYSSPILPSPFCIFEIIFYIIQFTTKQRYNKTVQDDDKQRQEGKKIENSESKTKQDENKQEQVDHLTEQNENKSDQENYKTEQNESKMGQECSEIKQKKNNQQLAVENQNQDKNETQQQSCKACYLFDENEFYKKYLNLQKNKTSIPNSITKEQ